MSKFLDMMMEKLGTVNLWPFLAGLIVLVVVLVLAIRYWQTKKLAENFNSGIIDDKTVKLCQKLKRRNRGKKNAQMHDVFCCTLSAMHLERKEEDLFFENLNSLKALTGTVTRRVNLLLVAYLTERRYLDLSVAYKEEKEEGESVQDWIFRQEDLDYTPQRLQTMKAKLTHDQVIEILDALVDEE